MIDQNWHAAVQQWLYGLCPQEAVAVCLPAYRPDLVERLALLLGLSFFDFRRERMAPLGWEAARLPLSCIDDCALDVMKSGQKGVMMQNAEALLAAYGEAERRAWLASVFSRSWPERFVLPLVLFQNELPGYAGRRFVLSPKLLPAESLLDRLQSLH